MKFETAIEECKPNMYYVFNQYTIDGYDPDDLFQETVIWILRDWETIINLNNCGIKTAIVNRARWVCNHLNYYKQGINMVPVSDIPEENSYEEFTELDVAHLFIRAKKKLSDEAFAVFCEAKEISTRREIQKQLSITDRPYQTAMKEIRNFLNDEGIYSNRG